MYADDDLLKIFHEEADELLAELEEVLLALEAGARSDDLIHEVFRLLHTLKGTCAMYEFSAAAGLAHEVETLFARARDGSIQLTSDLVELALRARDSIAELVAGDVIESATAVTAARAITQDLMDRMQEHAAVSGEIGESQPNLDVGDSAEATFSIRLIPRGDLFVRGVSLTGLLGELCELGDADVQLDASSVPGLNLLDPTQCYMTLRVELRTRRGIRAIEEALMFLDEGEYAIERVSRDHAPDQASGAGLAPGHGRSAQRGQRVSPERLDQLVNLVGELVAAHAWLREHVHESEDERLVDMAEEIGSLTHALRESVLGMRMVPIGTTYGRFTRYVRDLSKELGKQVVIETDGSSAELDRGVVERIEEPLLHIIRNSIDHGIEDPAERRTAGKAEMGTVRLSAFHSGGSMYVRVSDDGRGIDVDAVRARAIAAGALKPDEPLDGAKLAELVLSAGFSTAERVTAVSGRGVGLDVVRATVEDLQGAIELETQPGNGVTVTLRLPLTLAIIEGLLVAVGDEKYVLPLTNVEECVDLIQQAGWQEHGRDLLDIRGDIVPFARLRDTFHVEGEAPAEEIAVIADVDGERFGIVVDSVVDRLQVVIKTLGRALRRSEGVLGATMLGNGSVALIVDVGQVQRMSAAGDPATTGR